MSYQVPYIRVKGQTRLLFLQLKKQEELKQKKEKITMDEFMKQILKDRDPKEYQTFFPNEN